MQPQKINTGEGPGKELPAVFLNQCTFHKHLVPQVTMNNYNIIKFQMTTQPLVPKSKDTDLNPWQNPKSWNLNRDHLNSESRESCLLNHEGRETLGSISVLPFSPWCTGIVSHGTTFLPRLHSKKLKHQHFAQVHHQYAAHLYTTMLNKGPSFKSLLHTWIGRMCSSQRGSVLFTSSLNMPTIESSLYQAVSVYRGIEI